VANNRTGTLDKHLDPGSIYRNIVMEYARTTGIEAEAVGDMCPLGACDCGDKCTIE
jgi:hypothetical protein